MARLIIAIAALLLVSATTPLRAQDSLAERMTAERLGEIEPGAYMAGDTVKFSLAKDGDDFLLRFDGDPEVFVLYTAHASLGGRVLKYDSGETALQVASWGGMTLYTDAAPNGLPAVRSGDAIAPSPANVSLGDMQNAAGDEAEHLAYTRGLRLNFNADWSALAANAAMRAFAFDTLENTVRGLDRFSITAFGREALAKRIAMVMVAQGAKPTLGIKGKTLVVTFNPERGYEGRASSRAIARALEKVFPKK
jgi:hypothetical protein